MDPRYDLEFKDTGTTYHFSDQLDQCSFAKNMKQLKSVDFKQSNYVFNQALGSGQFAHAALFSRRAMPNESKSAPPENIVVKVVDLTACKYDSDKRDQPLQRQQELRFFKTNYPELSAYCAVNSYNQWILSVYSYFPGRNLYKTLKQNPAPTPIQILQIFLAMAEAISRMHAKGLIHGDLNGGNYIIDFDDKTKPPVVNIMDGERSYKITDEYATSTPQTMWSWSDCYFPPERTGNKKTKPNVSQDVYTFAHFLLLFYKNYGTYFPKTVRDVAECQIHHLPQKRPPLSDMINILRKELSTQLFIEKVKEDLLRKTADEAEANRKAAEDARIAEQQRKAAEQAKIAADKRKFYIHVTNLFKCSDNKAEFLSLLKNNLPLLSRHQILDLFADLKVRDGEYKFIHSQRNPTWDRFRLFFKLRANSEKNFWHTDTYQKAVKMLKDEYLGKGMIDPVDMSRYSDLHSELLSYVRGNGIFHKSQTGTFKQFTERMRIMDEPRNQLKF